MEKWISVDFPAVQKDLDADAEAIGSRRDASDASRKQLVQAVKAFRGSASDEVRGAVGSLMKLFQAEVDSLSKRSKAAELSFLAVYRKLVQAPNPVPLLQSAVEAERRAAASQAVALENARLKETIAEYRTEFNEMKNQDGTIKALKEQLRDLEQRGDAVVEEKVAQALAENQKKLAADELANSGHQNVLNNRLKQATSEVGFGL